MSSFFGRKSGKASKSSSSSVLQPPQLARAQSADAAMPRMFDVEPPLHKTQSERQTQTRTHTPAPSPSVLSASTSSSLRSREKRKPIVVHYAQSPVIDARGVAASSSDPAALTASNHSTSRRTGTYSTDMDDDSADEAPFDVESAMAGFASSFSPLGGSRASKRQSSKFSASAPLPTTRARSSTRARLSMSLTSSQRHAQRAELKAKKYDVEWRNDEDCACCQVCYAMFTKLSRRRHHCRVCGDLVCGDCSLDQVMLHGRFDAPKRACVACVTLLQAMRHCGDARVSVEGAAGAGSSKHQHQQQQSQLPDGGSSHAPAATPRYHDRLGEVHRVMAAGKKSERRGSTQSEMYVIASSWLRAWLAFTRSASDGAAFSDSSSGGGGGATGGDHHRGGTAYPSPSSNSSSRGPNIGDIAPPPGPINNLPLLELSKGKLVKRPELVRDDGLESSSSSDSGDYQLISIEVWEVLQRLYGGGPAVRVVSNDGFCDWIVDVAALLTGAVAAAKLPISSTVEHVLVTRHEAAVVTRASYISVEKAALISSGGYESHSAARASHARKRDPADKAAAMLASSGASSSSSAAAASDLRGSFASRTSHSQARVRPNSPQQQQYDSNRASSRQGHGQRLPGDDAQTARASVRASATTHGSLTPAHADASESDADHDLRSTSAGPKAATAASAFAVAMKQARLNAQKAIDDRSRGTRSADAA